MVESEQLGAALLAFTVAVWSAAAWPAPTVEPRTVEELVVTAKRRPTPAFEHYGNIEVLSNDDINRVGHQHVHELLNRVAGTWISRGSGQEHLTAIRSPVLTSYNFV